MKYDDITGKKFGRLTALEPRNGRNWLFVCDCGTLIEKRSSNVKFGSTQSCGCLRTRVARSPLYPNAKKPIGSRLREGFYKDLDWQGKSILDWSIELEEPPVSIIKRLLRDSKL